MDVFAISLSLSLYFLHFISFTILVATFHILAASFRAINPDADNLLWFYYVYVKQW